MESYMEWVGVLQGMAICMRAILLMGGGMVLVFQRRCRVSVIMGNGVMALRTEISRPHLPTNQKQSPQSGK